MMSPVLGANHEANPFNQLKTSLLFAVSGRRWSSADTVKRTALTELAFPVSASLPLGAPAHIPCVAQAGAGPGRRATREPAGRAGEAATRGAASHAVRSSACARRVLCSCPPSGRTCHGRRLCLCQVPANVGAGARAGADAGGHPTEPQRNSGALTSPRVGGSECDAASHLDLILFQGETVSFVFISPKV